MMAGNLRSIVKKSIARVIMAKQLQSHFISDGYLLFTRIYKYLRIMALFVSVLLLFLVIWTFYISRSNENLQTEIEVVQARVDQLSTSLLSAPSEQKIFDLTEKINQINSIVPLSAPTVAIVMEALENNLPRELWISQFLYTEDQGELSISVQSFSPEKLSTYLKILEEEPIFLSVLLARQTQFTHGDRQTLQYDLVVTTK